MALAKAAEMTERIRLGIAVSNFRTRVPSVLASALRTVSEFGPGRVVAGLGTGNSAVEPVGLRPTPRAELEAGINEVRTLLSGSPHEYVTGRVQVLEDPPSDVVPIYVAATGPKNLAFAGAAGDGAIILGGLTPNLLGGAIDTVHRGAEEAGRSASDVAIVSTGFCHVTDEPERDARMLKPIIVGMSVTGAQGALDALGVAVDTPTTMPVVRPDLIHARDWDEAVAACDPFVSDEHAFGFAEAFCLFGTTDYIFSGLERLASIGVTEVFLQHVGSYTFPQALLADLGDVLSRG